MVNRHLEQAVSTGRSALARLASVPLLQRVMAVTAHELERAVGTTSPSAGSTQDSGAPSSADTGAAEIYDGSYFGVDRDPTGDRQGRSGYASYDRVSSNADIAAYLLWRNFRFEKSLDIGCAKGFLVEALRERGVDARGCDISAFAVSHAVPAVAPFVSEGDLSSGLPFDDASFDLVTTLEILEHIDPMDIPKALIELRRVCGGVVYATIPSFGFNESGPNGHFEGKVRPERLAHYNAMADQFTQPIPRQDLAVDADGALVEGHLCIASFAWWTEQFAEAGFERWIDVEQRLYADIEPAGLAPYWNLYVFAPVGTTRGRATPIRPELSLADLGLQHPLIEHNANQ
jgi:Methyltransferase domain